MKRHDSVFHSGQVCPVKRNNTPVQINATALLELSSSSERMELISTGFVLFFFLKPKLSMRGVPIETAIITVITSTHWDADHLLLITVLSFKWDANVFSTNFWNVCINRFSWNMKDMSSDRASWIFRARRRVVTSSNALSLILIGPSRSKKSSVDCQLTEADTRETLERLNRVCVR